MGMYMVCFASSNITLYYHRTNVYMALCQEHQVIQLYPCVHGPLFCQEHQVIQLYPCAHDPMFCQEHQVIQLCVCT